MANTTEQTTNVETHEVVDTSGATADESLFASLGLNGQLFAFQLLNFAIVGAIVWYLILKPLTSKMEERKKMIDESIDNAKALETNLKMSEKKYQEKIDQAKVEANKIIEKSHGEAKMLGEEMKNRSQKDIELLVDQAKRNIEIEKKEVMVEVKNEVGTLVVAAVEKILGNKLDDKTDKKIVEDALKGLKK